MRLDIDTSRWVTVEYTHTVLMIVHNITTLSRMLDVVGAFDSDTRIQLYITSTPSDPFRHGLDELLESLEIIRISWEFATRKEFDLAITASHHDGIEKISAPLVVLSHGIGYTKYSPESREPRAESREPRAESREPRAESREPRAESREPS
ncbi:hypothetical protein AB0E01_35285, partial [Nocardia vinacea]|uniref:hypothetical protein n=1 Tax=Nocardia vinacea TaxID=96468 RepID=UPI0033CE91BA